MATDTFVGLGAINVTKTYKFVGLGPWASPDHILLQHVEPWMLGRLAAGRTAGGRGGFGPRPAKRG